MTEPIGLIAGGGRLPILVAEGMRRAGRPVVCVGLHDQYDAELPSLCDRFAVAGVLRLGAWCRLLRRFGARDTIMVGKVHKTLMYTPRCWLHMLPDLRTAWLYLWTLRHDRRPATLLRGIATELAKGGITLVDSTIFIADAMAEPGVLTRRPPTRQQALDIEFGWPLVKAVNELDIGQAIAVLDGDVIAVEAIEGTDAMIERAGRLCRCGGWTLIKTGKHEQDMRFDVPTIGPNTIRNLHAAGGRCLVVEAGKVIFVDKAELLALADQLGIVIVGR